VVQAHHALTMARMAERQHPLGQLRRCVPCDGGPENCAMLLSVNQKSEIIRARRGCSRVRRPSGGPRRPGQPSQVPMAVLRCKFLTAEWAGSDGSSRGIWLSDPSCRHFAGGIHHPVTRVVCKESYSCHLAPWMDFLSLLLTTERRLWSPFPSLTQNGRTRK
jgi:hypothetical protein